MCSLRGIIESSSLRSAIAAKDLARSTMLMVLDDARALQTARFQWRLLYAQAMFLHCNLIRRAGNGLVVARAIEINKRAKDMRVSRLHVITRKYIIYIYIA